MGIHFDARRKEFTSRLHEFRFMQTRFDPAVFLDFKMVDQIVFDPLGSAVKLDVIRPMVDMDGTGFTI